MGLEECEGGITIVAFSGRWERGDSIWTVDRWMDGLDGSCSHVHQVCYVQEICRPFYSEQQTG